MRVLKGLFISLLLIGFVAGGAFLLGRELLLLYATSQVKGAVKSLKTAAANPEQYYYQCQEKGGTPTQAIPSVFQLRFTSDTDYQLEVICQQFPTDPIILSQRQLPLLVHKSPGNSGVIWGAAESRLNLQLLGRKTAVLVQDKQLSTTAASKQLGSIPQTSCVGYGYTCCQEETTVGQGEQEMNSSDCPRTCFEACVSRPIILSFTSNPSYDTAQRTLTIPNNSSVTFAYVVDGGAGELANVTLDYGDGSQADLQSETGGQDHVFNCAVNAQCYYTVSITATDRHNRPSAVTPISSIQLIVTR